MTNEELWRFALGEIEINISKANFITWFRHTGILKNKDGLATIGVPNGFSKEWLENKYNKLILRALRNASAEIKELKFIINTSDLAFLPEKTIRIQNKKEAVQALEQPFQELEIDKETNLNPKYTFANFIVGSFNELAQAAAKAVIGSARNPAKLQRALSYGADFVISSQDKQIKDIRNEFRDICKKNGLEAGFGWKIFEVTGIKAGQDMALELLSFTGKLVVVGFGMSKNEYMLSRLMAFDADILGTWGCLPEYYPIVLDMVLSKKIDIGPFTETRPMSQIASVFDEVHKAGSPEKRIVLTPDF